MDTKSVAGQDVPSIDWLDCKIFIMGKEVPLRDALEEMDWNLIVDEGEYCGQTVLDMANALTIAMQSNDQMCNVINGKHMARVTASQIEGKIKYISGLLFFIALVALSLTKPTDSYTWSRVECVAPCCSTTETVL